jgi:hypothetical protein
VQPTPLAHTAPGHSAWKKTRPGAAGRHTAGQEEEWKNDSVVLSCLDTLKVEPSDTIENVKAMIQVNFY